MFDEANEIINKIIQISNKIYARTEKSITICVHQKYSHIRDEFLRLYINNVIVDENDIQKGYLTKNHILSYERGNQAHIARWSEDFRILNLHKNMFTEALPKLLEDMEMILEKFEKPCCEEFLKINDIKYVRKHYREQSHFIISEKALKKCPACQKQWTRKPKINTNNRFLKILNSF